MSYRSRPPSKPSIICLHGGGTSAAIFDCQTARLQRILQTDFEFVFIDAPFASPPGPGVLPVYEGCDPFFAWQSSDTTAAEIMPQEVDDLLESVFQACMRRGSLPVGILGFSQGARVATGLLLSNKEIFSSIRFGILLNGTSPALQIVESHVEDGSRELRSKYFSEKLTVLLEFHTGHQMPSQQRDTQALAESIVAAYAVRGHPGSPQYQYGV